MANGPLGFPNTLPENATAGERRLFDILKKVLPEDSLIFYEPYIRDRRQNAQVFFPDFVILSPSMGLLVLEVKDWKNDTLVEGDTNTVSIKTDRGVVKEQNPYMQARGYTFNLIGNLQTNKILLDKNGKLKFSYQYGVVLTNISLDQFVRRQLNIILPGNQVLNKDDLADGAIDNLLPKIKGMFAVKKNHKMTREERDICRRVIYPEVPKVDDAKILDPYQEHIAISIEDGHRLLRGVPGSGKTLILAYRAHYLKLKHPDWKILITCYNISLASYIKAHLRRIDPVSAIGIEVIHFHGLLHKLFADTAGKPDMTDDKEVDNFILAQLENGTPPKIIYDAILVDEGQDFQESWAKLLLKMRRNSDSAFIIAEDNNQNIFRRGKNAWNAAGLNFQGRSVVLNHCYRNCSFYFALGKRTVYGNKKLLDDYKATFDTRDFFKPDVLRERHNRTLVDAIDDMIQRMRNNGFENRDIGVIYIPGDPNAGQANTKYCIVVPLIQQLKNNNIPVYWISETQKSKTNLDMSSDQIKVTTIFSAKGLEFRGVILIGMENLDGYEKIRNPDGIAFTAITRGRDFVGLASNDSGYYVDAFLKEAKTLVKLGKPGSKKVQWGNMKYLYPEEG